MYTKAKLKRHLEFLRFLKRVKRKDYSTLLPYLSDDSITLLSELCYNVLYNESIFKRKQDLKKLRSKLCPYKAGVKLLSKKQTPVKRKRSYLVSKQKGEGILSGLVSVLIPVVSYLLGLAKK